MAKRNKEFELKFTGSPRDIAALPDSLFFGAICQDQGEWKRLTTTYYDTADAALSRGGRFLRIRESSGQLLQTVKVSNHTGAAIDRDGFEAPLKRYADFPAKTGDPTIDKQIDAHKSELQPIVRIVVDRWVALVQFKSSEIEISVDLGRSEAWPSEDGEAEATFETPLAEVELELKSGTAVDVFDLGRLLAQNAPLRLCVRSKFETALGISLEGFAGIRPLKKVDPQAGETAADLLQRNLAQSAFRLVDLQPVLTDGRKREAVHQMRVALRRLRTLERMFRPYLRSECLAKIAVTAKLNARELGAARDWDVFLDETLPQALKNGERSHDAYRLLRAAEALRAKNWASAVATVHAPEFTVFLIDLLEAAFLSSWRVDAKKALSMKVTKFAPYALNRSWKKTKALAANTQFDDLSALHRLRLGLKKHRYSLQIFRAIYPKELRRGYMSDLSALQELFGTVNDAATGQRLADIAARGNGDEAMHIAGFVCGYKAAQSDAAMETIRVRCPEMMAKDAFWQK